MRLELDLITLHVSEPYNSTAFTLELNSRSLVLVEMAVDFQTGRRTAKACWAFHMSGVLGIIRVAGNGCMCGLGWKGGEYVLSLRSTCRTSVFLRSEVDLGPR
jgi:hypothetical protein